MKAIVIDDLIHVTNGIMSGVSWLKLNIDEVFKAHNINEAKKIFNETPIDIMICDIEMPMGSGLELLEWVRLHYTQTVCIFLTSHDEFVYAKQAIALDGFDYLLQPIAYSELEKVIARAVDKVLADKKLSTYYNYGVYWEDSKLKIIEKFWYDILSDVYKQDTTKILSVAQKLNIKISLEKSYRVVLLSVFRREIVLSEWNDDLLKYSLANILMEILEVDNNDFTMVQLDSSTFGIVLEEKFVISEEKLMQLFEHFISVSFRMLKCSLAGYVSNEMRVEEFSKNIRLLKGISEDNVARKKKVFHISDNYFKKSGILEIPFLSKWETLIELGENETLYTEIKGFLYQQLDNEQLNAHTLFEFQQVFIQMLYHVFETKQIDTSMILQEKEALKLYIKSLNSIDDMLLFIKWILSIKVDENHVNQYYEHSIEVVKKYILGNIEKDLLRNELAERVFLNPEYLSRLFKKKVGVSLSTYIANERVRVAKELLKNTDMSVSIIASKVGYSNFSHFSQVFKKYTNVTPLEYRQNYR